MPRPDDPLDDTFQALADPTRRAILARLASGEATVGELAAPFEISLPAISRHLKVLEGAALITNQREGKHRRIALRPETLDGAAEWLDFHRRFLSGSFLRLGQPLKQKAEKKGTKPRTSSSKTPPPFPNAPSPPPPRGGLPPWRIRAA